MYIDVYISRIGDVHIHIYVHTCMYTYTHVYIHAYQQNAASDTFVQTIHTHTNTHTHIHTCVHTYINIHTPAKCGEQYSPAHQRPALSTLRKSPLGVLECDFQTTLFAQLPTRLSPSAHVFLQIYMHKFLYPDVRWYEYGVASDSRIDKIIGLFCKRAL